MVNVSLYDDFLMFCDINIFPVKLNCKIPTALIVGSLVPYPLSASVTRRYVLYYISEISSGYGISFLMDIGYHTYLPIYTSYFVLLSTYLVKKHVPSQDLNRGINALN